MNGVQFAVTVLAFAFLVGIFWARRLDLADDYAEAHLMHGPKSECLECEDK